MPLVSFPLSDRRELIGETHYWSLKDLFARERSIDCLDIVRFLGIIIYIYMEGDVIVVGIRGEGSRGMGFFLNPVSS